MAGEWPTVTVEQLVDGGVLDRPMDGNHGEIHPKGSDFVSSGIPFIMASDLADGRVDTTHCAFIREEQARKLRKGFALPGDVLISHKATMGRTAIIEPSKFPFLMLTPQVTYYRVLEPARLNNRYLKYYFDSPPFQQLFDTWGQKGSTRAYLGITAQLDLPIIVPPPPEQQAIACVLGSLDDKIELNRRRNRTLEAMARAIFQSWFVDFDPVRAKAAGREPAGLSRELAALFPDAFTDSALGPIPKGWRVESLDRTANFLNGLALQKYPPCGGETLAVIKIAQLRRGSTEGADRCNTDVPREYVVEDGDVLFSWSGSLECALWSGGKGALNQHLFKVTSDLYAKWFYYMWVHHHLPHFRHIAAGKATTMGHIQRHHLSDAKVVLADSKIHKYADRLLTPIIGQIIQHSIEARTLAALRDVLLPKLISGALRVPDAERIVGRAT